MKAHLILHFDGRDERRLDRVLQGQSPFEVLEEMLRQLFWWHHELDGKCDTNGYLEIFQRPNMSQTRTQDLV